MPQYLVQFSYTPEAWAAQLKNPTNRVDAARPLLERLGARFETVYYAFGEDDIVFIMEAPDNQTAAAVALALTAGGAIKAFKTTPLMAIEEGIGAIRKAGEAASAYRPPTAS
jgi:uncharacterized protein with GYD domain